jgi:hypothetical protein
MKTKADPIFGAIEAHKATWGYAHQPNSAEKKQ